ncbi:uncharacterized protein [Cebidichthys violaceus]|uniref:uncharacterized protein n=1 Tax=Cebidichthys violaceus TaxID=271503 RepID=UPI0035CAE959
MATRRRYDVQFKERVLEHEEQNSAEETARHFNIDIKRIRYWRRQKEELLQVSEELEEKLWEWIHSMKHQRTAVTRTAITRRALEVYPSASDGGKAFVSTGWLQRFLQRNRLSLRRRSAEPAANPEVLTEKLVGFIDRVGRTVSGKKISEGDIIAMDETAVCLGLKRQSRITVVLAAAANGTKLKPFIVFRGTVDEETAGSAVVKSSVNGWMSDALTKDWLQAVVGKSNGAPRLLVWDSYRCHVGAATKAELSGGYDVTTAAIPRGCTRFVQAADVMWKEPFRQAVQDAYRRWVDEDAEENLRPPPRRLLVDWVVSAWDKLDPDLIRKSFKVCGLSVKRDGGEDHLVLCFRDGQPCSAGRDRLTQVRQQNQNQENQEEEEEDEEELFNNELVVLDDEEAVQEKDAVMPVMSATAPPAHLQCPLCGHFSKSHAHQLTHLAASHPTRLDGATVGRLGNILMYQNTAKLFHCVECFYTSRDFTKIYKHLISRHCEDHRGEEDRKEEKKTSEEEEGEKDAVKRSGEEEERKKTGEEEEEQKKTRVEEEEQKKTKEEEEEQKKTRVEEEGPDEDVSSQKEEGDESVLMFDGAGYHCLICGWKTKLKALGVNHVVRKHDIPKAYASQAIRRDANVSADAPRPAEEEEGGGAGLSGEQLKEEMEATAKVVRFISNRFVCLICGWKTKLKGFAISHVVRCHDVERPYGCLSCSRSFFLPSRLQQHVRAAHRPGRYACPFCCFRSHFIGGFRRHCSRCNAREEGEEGGREGGGGGGGEEEEKSSHDDDVIVSSS